MHNYWHNSPFTNKTNMNFYICVVLFTHITACSLVVVYKLYKHTCTEKICDQV